MPSPWDLEAAPTKCAPKMVAMGKNDGQTASNRFGPYRAEHPRPRVAVTTVWSDGPRPLDVGTSRELGDTWSRKGNGLGVWILHETSALCRRGSLRPEGVRTARAPGAYPARVSRSTFVAKSLNARACRSKPSRAREGRFPVRRARRDRR